MNAPPPPAFQLTAKKYGLAEIMFESQALSTSIVSIQRGSKKKIELQQMNIKGQKKMKILPSINSVEFCEEIGNKKIKDHTSNKNKSTSTSQALSHGTPPPPMYGCTQDRKQKIRFFWWVKDAM